MILYEVIDYLQNRVNNDIDFEEEIKVIEAYRYSHKLNHTELQVQVIDHTEYDRFTTFEDGKVYISPLQINVYGSQMKIGNEVVSAQKCAYILAQKVIDWLNVNDMTEVIPEIISAKNGTYSSGRPLVDIGTVIYSSVVRIDLYLRTN